MSIFASQDFFEISLRYIERKTKGGFANIKILNEKSEEDKKIIEDNENVKSITTQWSQMSWKDQNALQRQCLETNPETGLKGLNWMAYQALILETCMKKWDAEEEGRPIPCTREFINKLNPVIAGELINKYYDMISIADEDLGN